MGLAKSIIRRLQTAGRILAMVAAFALAAGLHPPHAEAAPAPGHHGTHSQAFALHGHLAIICLQAEIASAQDAGQSSLPGGHADCSQVCAPFVRPLASALPALVSVALTRSGNQSFRHIATAFDPPPPRRA